MTHRKKPEEYKGFGLEPCQHLSKSNKRGRSKERKKIRIETTS